MQWLPRCPTNDSERTGTTVPVLFLCTPNMMNQKGVPFMGKHEITANVMKLCISCFLAFGILLAGVLLLTFLMDGNKLSEEMLGYGITLAVLIASTFGSALFLHGSKGIGRGLLFAAFLWASLLAIAALLFDGTFHGVWVTLILIIGGSMLPALIGKGKNGHRFAKGNHRLHR